MASDDVPPIGAAVSLGEDRDAADAEVIHDLAAVLAGSAYTGRARRVMREAVWFLWEEPRLPRPLIGGKYPLSYPWSPGARIVAASAAPQRGGRGLIIEHAVPRTLLVRDLIDGAQERTAGEVLALLRNGTHATVLTRDEDSHLTAAGLRDTLPAGADPQDAWARYKAAGLDPAHFAPLDSRPEGRRRAPSHDNAPEVSGDPQLTWDRVRAQARARATAEVVAVAPRAPGVYVWFRDGEPVYLGIATNLHARLRTHRNTTTRPGKSTLRASVGAQVTGLPRTLLRTPGRYVPEEAMLIDAWLDGCELAWFETDSRETARQAEKALNQQWRPPLNLAD